MEKKRKVADCFVIVLRPIVGCYWLVKNYRDQEEQWGNFNNDCDVRTASTPFRQSGNKNIKDGNAPGSLSFSKKGFFFHLIFCSLQWSTPCVCVFGNTNTITFGVRNLSTRFRWLADDKRSPTNTRSTTRREPPRLTHLCWRPFLK